ncbi:Transcriptional regulator, MerR family [Olavius sp. associated proteobacterium Delta 1]|nr:Transcriptional regulator, MerR family [Olavius sp. associated proteobacterium Delta 1]
MPRKKKAAPVPIGKKIKKARTSKKFSFDRVANETGFSTEYLKEVESGKAIPPVGALLQIARALQIDSGSLLKEPESKLESRIKAQTKRTDNYAYTTLTPGAENKHLKAFRVIIEAQQDHKGVDYHHEGEEFVYVLAGRVEVAVGEHVNTLEQGDSLHFNSGIQHKLKSASDERAELIVVIYSP